MKALVLSVIIALSGSFASASCPLDPANITQNSGSYTRQDKLKELTTHQGTQVVDAHQQGHVK